MPRGPRKLRVATDGVGLTQFGGVALIEQLFQRLGLQGSFSQHIRFPQRNNRYSGSEPLEALLYPLISAEKRRRTPLSEKGHTSQNVATKHFLRYLHTRQAGIATSNGHSVQGHDGRVN